MVDYNYWSSIIHIYMVDGGLNGEKYVFDFHIRQQFINTQNVLLSLNVLYFHFIYVLKMPEKKKKIVESYLTTNCVQIQM